MHFVNTLFWRFRKTTVPGAMLMMLLQRTPVLSVAAATEEIIIASPAGTVLKAVIAGLAALGGMHTLAGASELNVSAGTATGITVQKGAAMSVSFDLPGSDPGSVGDPVGKWTLGIGAGSSFPPGLNFSGLTGAGTVSVVNPQLSGTATTAGVFHLTLQAFSSDNAFSTQVYNYTVTVNAPNVAPSFSMQPVGQVVTTGDPVTFTATADGSPAPTYQWRKDTVNIPGATNSSLMIVSAQAGDAASYTVVATNVAGNATSNAAVLTVNPASSAPSFSVHPQSQAITAGNPVTFTAAANGTPAPTYQWRKDLVNIGGATNSSLTIGSVAPGDAGSYTVVATNTAGSVSSNAATLTVNVAPAFTLHPQSQTVTVGSPVTFTATATGAPAPTYQWRKDGVNIAGATNSAYMIASTSAGDAGTYTVVATNVVTSMISNAATLVVNLAPPVIALVADFDGDGHAEPLWRNVVSGLVVSWTSGSGFRVFGSESDNWAVINAGDFDGDGIIDVLWHNTVSGLVVSWTSSSGFQVYGIESDGWQVIKTGDFDGDGKCDILWHNVVSGLVVSWMTSNGFSVLGVEDAGWAVIDTQDLDGDGKTDILWHNTNSTLVAAWGTASGFHVFGVESDGWQAIGAGDFDGDGKADVLWHNTISGIVASWTTTGGFVVFGIESDGWQVIGNGDIDGDGRAEPLWFNSGSSQISAWTMAGMYINYGTESAGWKVVR